MEQRTIRRHKLRDTHCADRSSPRPAWLHYPNRAVSFFRVSLSYYAQSSHTHRVTRLRVPAIGVSGLALYYISPRSSEGQRASRVAAAALDRAQQLRRSDPARPTARREAAIVTTRRATTRYGQATCSRRWTKRTREKYRERERERGRERNDEEVLVMERTGVLKRPHLRIIAR